MSIFELIGYTRRRIRGRRAEILLICLPPIAAELVFRLGEAAFYSLLLYFGALSPPGLFTGELVGQLVIAAFVTALRWTASAPLRCAAAVRLRELTGEGTVRSSASELILDGRFLRRSITAHIAGRLLGFAALAPAAALGAYAYALVSDGGGSSELFAASNLAAAAAVFAVLWLAVRLSITAVPFLLAEYPDRSALGCVFMSLRFMRGRKRIPLALTALAAVPIFLPGAAAAFATGVSIFIREDEYAASVGKSVAFPRRRRPLHGRT